MEPRPALKIILLDFVQGFGRPSEIDDWCNGFGARGHISATVHDLGDKISVRGMQPGPKLLLLEVAFAVRQSNSMLPDFHIIAESPATRVPVLPPVPITSPNIVLQKPLHAPCVHSREAKAVEDLPYIGVLRCPVVMLLSVADFRTPALSVISTSNLPDSICSKK